MTIGMALSKYHIKSDGEPREPGIRVASSLDFFRGEAGAKYWPDIFDDGDLPDQPLSKMKAFFDQSLADAKSKERWSTAQWEQNQLRIGCENKYDPSAEDEVTPTAESIRFARFLDLIRPAFHANATAADILAILKRAHVVVNTKKCVYFRLAGIGEEAVPIFRYADGVKDYLADSCKPALALFRKGKRAVPDGYVADCEWEFGIVQQLLAQGIPPPRSAIVRVTDPFSGERFDQEVKPSAMGGSSPNLTLLSSPATLATGRDAQLPRLAEVPAVAPAAGHAAVAKEELTNEMKERVFKRARTWSALSKSEGVVIDLDSPSPMAQKRNPLDDPEGDFEEEV